MIRARSIWIWSAITIATAAALLTWAWRSQVSRATFYTDADRIHAPATTAPVRRILWQPAHAVDGAINTAADEYEPRVSADGSRMIFVRGRPGHNADLYECSWTAAGWSDPKPIVSINSPADELGPELAGDGRSLYFYSDRAGGLGGYDLWVSGRDGDGWGAPSNLGPEVNTEFNEYGPAVSADGLQLYFASNRSKDGSSPSPREAWTATVREERGRPDYDLYVSRVGASGREPARPIDALNTSGDEGAPALSPAGDFLYFASDRAGGLGGFDVYRSRLVRGSFQAPENLGDAVNSPSNDLDPALSMDGFRLYFSSNRASSDTARPPSASGSTTGADAAHPRDYGLWFTCSREVFTEVDPGLARAGIFDLLGAIWPWLLLLLLTAALVWLCWRFGTDPVWRDRYRKLSLLAKCLLVSLALHAMLASLFAVWRVGSQLGDYLRRGGSGTRVVLGSAGASGGIAGQVRDLSAPLTIQPAMTAVAAAPVMLMVPRAPIERPDVPPSFTEPVLSAVNTAPPSSEPTPTPTTSPNFELAALPVEAPNLQSRVPAAVQPTTSVEASSRITPNTAPSTPNSAGVPRLDLPSPAVVMSPARAPSTPDTAPALDIPIPSSPIGAAPSTAATSPAVAPAWSGAASPSLSSRVPPVPAAPSGGRSAEPSPSAVVTTTTPPAPAVGLARSDIAGAQASIDPPALARGELAALGSFTPTQTDATPAQAGASQALQASPPGATQSREAVELGGLRIPEATGPATAANGASGAESEIAQAMPTGAALAAPPTIALDGVGSRGPGSVSIDPPALRPGADRAGPVDVSASVAPAPSASSATAPTVASASPVSAPAGLGLRLPTVEAEITPPEDFAQRNPERRAEVLEKMGGTADTERAVGRALDWLAAHQSPDGRWSGTRFDERGGECGGHAEVECDAAQTGMALLCFLGAGHTHAADGPYRSNVARALTWLVSRQTSGGDLRRGETMYSQAIATVALCEAFAMTRDAALETPTRRAFEFLSAGAGKRGRADETSVLGWQVMATESARRAGLRVPPATFDAARRWLDTVSVGGAGGGGGGGLYAHRPGDPPNAAMTAEAMFVQQLLGHSRAEPRMEQSARFILGTPPRWKNGAPTYYWYYATLAMFQHQGEAWKSWNEALAPELLNNQRADGPCAGSWDPQDEWSKLGGRIYQTAVCTLSLEVYYRYRPAGATEVSPSR